LVWAIVILWQELKQAEPQSLYVIPGYVAQPIFEREYKALGNPITFWAMAIDRDVNETGF
jgi:hypothetical protein